MGLGPLASVSVQVSRRHQREGPVPRLRGSVTRRENFSQASLTAGCLGDGPPLCVREFTRCGPNGIRVATVTVNFPHPVGLPHVGLESAPVRG